MLTGSLRALTAVLGSVALVGCESLQLQPPANYGGMAEVTPVITEHSFGLQCLGAVIDDSGVDPLLVHVDDIRDRTIPSRLNDVSRLSQAGEWLVHTAISKLETDRVRSTLDDGIAATFTIGGAWTQDDELMRRSGGLLDVGWLKGRLGLSGRNQFDYIAGDFVTSVDGVVIFSTAIGVMLGSRRIEARLLIEDGDEFAEIGFEGRWADGPQLAQRRIAEAATLIHVANYLDVDYRPCLEGGWGNPSSFRASLKRYEEMGTEDRNAHIQRRLAELGHDPGLADGQWGEASRRALMAYQTKRRLPVTGELSPVVFAILDGESPNDG